MYVCLGRTFLHAFGLHAKMYENIFVHCFYANKSWYLMYVYVHRRWHIVQIVEEPQCPFISLSPSLPPFCFPSFFFLSFLLSCCPSSSWATSGGNGEGPVSSLNAANVCLRLGTRAQRHTQSWHTQRSPLSPLCHRSVTFPLFRPSPHFPPSRSHSPPIRASLIFFQLLLLHCTAPSLKIFQLCFLPQTALSSLGSGCYNRLHLPFYLCALVHSN